ncbi:MAG: substrate-binding periplasmic protein [Cellvibrionaceae bacterium]
MSLAQSVAITFTLMWSSITLGQPKDLPTKVVLAATDWCPYSCANSDATGQHRGVLVDYLDAMFKGLGIELEVQFYPWSRAVALARRGDKVHGLLSAVHSEAPDMLFSQVPTMSYRTCVFTRKDSQWEYSSEQSFNALRLGYIQDYGYGGFVDEYIFSNQGLDHLMAITGNGGVMQLSRILRANRIDAFVSDPLVVSYDLRSENYQLKVSACFEEQPFHLSLNPDLAWAQALMNRLDASFERQSSREILGDMIADYLKNKEPN